MAQKKAKMYISRSGLGVRQRVMKIGEVGDTVFFRLDPQGSSGNMTKATFKKYYKAYRN